MIGVRSFVEWHLGRPGTRSDHMSARRSAHLMEAAGHCQLQQVQLLREAGGRWTLVMARPGLSLNDWPTQKTLRTAADQYPPDTHGARAALDRLTTSLNAAAAALNNIPLGALTPDEAATAAQAMGQPLAALGRMRRRLRRRSR